MIFILSYLYKTTQVLQFLHKWRELDFPFNTLQAAPHIFLKMPLKSLQMFQLNNLSTMLCLGFGCCCTYNIFFTSLLIASWNEQWQKICIMSTREKIYNRKVYDLFISSFFSSFLNNLTLQSSLWNLCSVYSNNV